MGPVEVCEARSRAELKAFVAFPMKLYAQCPYYVPPLIGDELSTFVPEKNPALDNADAKLFLARRNGEVVGRIAAINSHIANQVFQSKNIRFGWFDAVDDFEVAKALFDAAEAWGRSLGMETITGPQGFNDFDRTGLLIEGFESVPTIATSYNYPYYAQLMDRYGFQKEVDSIEFRILNLMTKPFPPRLRAYADRLKERKGYRLLQFRSRKHLFERADEIFALLEQAYSDLYGVVPLSASQRNYYVNKFFYFLHPDLIKVVANKEDKIIGLCVAMPSLSKGMQKAKGRLLPFGALHLFLSTRKPKLVDFLLAAVDKGYRGRGVDLVLSSEMYKTLMKWGFEEGESNPELETNYQVQAEWKTVDHKQIRRRRIYRKIIGC